MSRHPAEECQHAPTDPIELDALVDLAGRKCGRSVSVCIPARDEASTIGPIVSTIRGWLIEQAGIVDEIVVVDDGSTDATERVAREAGARVVSASAVLPDIATGPGKGEAMWRGLFESEGDLIVFLDADVVGFCIHFVTRLIRPLLHDDGVALVKAFYDRPYRGEPGAGGRVTELVAGPTIDLLFPHLSHVRQPLAGESAARREVLEQISFAGGYGVELGLLIDVAARWGADAIAQVDLGERAHRNRSLAELRPQAAAVLRVALTRAGIDAPRSACSARVLRDGEAPAVYEGDCPPLLDVPVYRRRSA